MANALYSGSYAARSRRVRAAAYADPATVCWECGRTLAEEQERWSQPVTWDAGHVRDGDPTSPLRAEHSTCNRGKAQRRLKQAAELKTSRRWF